MPCPDRRSRLSLPLVCAVTLAAAGCSVVEGGGGRSGGSTFSNLLNYGSTTEPPIQRQGDVEASSCPAVLVLDGRAAMKQGGAQVSISNLARECIEKPDGTIVVKVGVEGLALLGSGGGGGRFSVPVVFQIRQGERVVVNRTRQAPVAIAPGYGPGLLRRGRARLGRAAEDRRIRYRSGAWRRQVAPRGAEQPGLPRIVRGSRAPPRASPRWRAPPSVRPSTARRAKGPLALARAPSRARRAPRPGSWEALVRSRKGGRAGSGQWHCLARRHAENAAPPRPRFARMPSPLKRTIAYSTSPAVEPLREARRNSARRLRLVGRQAPDPSRIHHAECVLGSRDLVLGRDGEQRAARRCPPRRRGRGGRGEVVGRARVASRSGLLQPLLRRLLVAGTAAALRAPSSRGPPSRAPKPFSAASRYQSAAALASRRTPRPWL